MAAKDKSISLKWSDELQEIAERVAKHYAGEMGIMGISTRSATREGGGETFNRSGAIEFALRKLDQLSKENSAK